MNTKKTTLLLLSTIIVIVFSFGLFTAPQKASAQFVPVNDLNANASLVTLNTSVATANAQLLTLNTLTKAACAKNIGPMCIPTVIPITMDTVVNFIAKQMASVMVQSMTQWVKNGFDGSPAFVENLQVFVEQLAQDVAVDLASDLVGADVCNFFPDISLDIKLSTPQSSLFAYKARCTIDDVILDAEAFYDDFTSGDWITFEASLEKNNNPFGLLITAQEEFGRRTAAKRDVETQKLSWGRGFLTTEDRYGNTYTPGATTEAYLSLVTGYDVRSLELADEFDELFNALVSYAAKTAITSAGIL